MGYHPQVRMYTRCNHDTEKSARFSTARALTVIRLPIAIYSLTPRLRKLPSGADSLKRSSSPRRARLRSLGVGREMTDPPVPARPTLSRQPTPNKSFL